VIGTLVGQYRIVSAIGTGAIGTVYLGEHTLIKRRAAIKVLGPEPSQHRELIDRYFQEARAAAAVKHPGIVQIFDFGFVEDGSAYLVMELLDGRSLAARLRTIGPLPPRDALGLAHQAASALAATHAAGIVHRALKPENLFLVTDPKVTGGLRVKIADFGIAKLSTARGALPAEPGARRRTPLYMAPEQFDGKADPRSDVYALGCVLFEALIGTPPFPGASVPELARLHASQEPPRPSLRAPALAPDIDTVVLRCLEKDPARRFPSMTELAQAIEVIPPRGLPPGAEVPALEARELSEDPGDPESGPAPGAPPTPRPPMPQAAPAAPTGAMPATPVPGNAAASETARRGFSWSSSSPAPAPASVSTAPPSSASAASDEIVSPWPSLFIRDSDDDDRLARGLATVIERAVPPGLRDALDDLVEFVGGLFATAQRFEDGVVTLDTPIVKDLASRAHYIQFLDEREGTPGTPLTELSTAAFRGRVEPLAHRLAQAKAPPGSVLITILAAPQLGQGTREAIFALRKELDLFIVPIAASEIRRARDAGNARDLLLHRIADLHTISDPFAVTEGFIDPTRSIGFAAEVTDLIRHVTHGGRIVSVAGPPGSGKTSVVALAEYGCDTSNVARRFIHLQAREVASRDPEALVRQLHDRIRPLDGTAGSAPPTRPSSPAAEAPDTSDLRAKIMELGAWTVASPSSAEPPRPPSEAGPARRPQLVIVLEDADWLIRLSSSSEPDAPRRERAQALWRGLAQLCETGGHTVIVTSVRGFQVMDATPLEQPISISRVKMQALHRHESDRLVTSLGELVGFSPTEPALAALHRESGGNVFTLRLLCSTVIHLARERPDYAPLARLVVTPGLVTAAAAHIAAAGPTFRPHVSVWLDETEKAVLQHVARAHPRSARSIRRALEGSADTAQIARALDDLELMGLVESRRGRHRVRIPLFERWINIHLDAPPRQRDAIKQARISWIAIGCTVTALLFGAYWTWLRSTRSTQAVSVGSCTFELDYPDRIGAEETFELFLYQDCQTVEKHALALEPVRSSLSIPAPSTDCAQTASCTAIFKPVAGQQAHDDYQVRLRVDGQRAITAQIHKDRFAALRTIGEKTGPTLAFIPLLLGFVLAFYKDVKRFIATLWRRGGNEPAATEPGEPPKP
jgi:serine/threonine protein kinase